MSLHMSLHLHRHMSWTGLHAPSSPLPSRPVRGLPRASRLAPDQATDFARRSAESFFTEAVLTQHNDLRLEAEAKGTG